MNPAVPSSLPILALPPGRSGRRRRAWTASALLVALLVALLAAISGPARAADELLPAQSSASDSERPRVDPCEVAVLRALLGLAPLSHEACPQLASSPKTTANQPNKDRVGPVAAVAANAPASAETGDANPARAARLAEEALRAQAEAEAAEADAADAEQKALRAEATARQRRESGDDRESRS